MEASAAARGGAGAVARGPRDFRARHFLIRVRENGCVSDAPPEIPAPDAGIEQVTVRRAPKISVFLVVGGGFGAVVTFILTSLFPVDPLVGFGPLFAYFALFGVTGGVLLGAVIALIVDRRSRKRARPAEAEFITEKRPEQPIG